MQVNMRVVNNSKLFLMKQSTCGSVLPIGEILYQEFNTLKSRLLNDAQIEPKSSVSDINVSH